MDCRRLEFIPAWFFKERLGCDPYPDWIHFPITSNIKNHVKNVDRTGLDKLKTEAPRRRIGLPQNNLLIQRLGSDPIETTSTFSTTVCIAFYCSGYEPGP